MSTETMAAPTLQQVADRLADRLRRSVTVVDPDIRILCASRHFGDEDPARVGAILQREALPEVYRHIHDQNVRSWAAPGRIPAAPQLGFAQRLALPVRCRERLLGFVMIIESDRCLSAEEMSAAQATASEAGEVLQHSAAGDAGDQVEQMLAALVGERVQERERAQAEAAWLFGPSACVSVVRFAALGGAGTLVPSGAELRAGLEAVCRQRGTDVYTVGPEHSPALLWVGTGAPTEAEVRALAVQAVAQVGPRGDGAAECVAGTSRPVPLGEAATACQDAQVALRAACLLPRLRPVADVDRLGPYAALLRMPPEQLPRVVPRGLWQLRDADPQGVLVDTLRRYLEEAGAAPAAAEALHVHRTSLYYRLRQIEQLTGMALSSGTNRADLHLGLCALELMGTDGPAQP